MKRWIHWLVWLPFRLLVALQYHVYWKDRLRELYPRGAGKPDDPWRKTPPVVALKG